MSVFATLRPKLVLTIGSESSTIVHFDLVAYTGCQYDFHSSTNVHKPVLVFFESAHSTVCVTSMFKGVSNAEILATPKARLAMIEVRRIVGDLLFRESVEGETILVDVNALETVGI